jgi:hypothetical protein
LADEHLLERITNSFAVANMLGGLRIREIVGKELNPEHLRSQYRDAAPRGKSWGDVDYSSSARK